MDEPIAYYTERSMSERERKISYTNAYIWNLEKWYQIIYLQCRSGETDREQTKGHGEKGWESEMYGNNYMKTYITVYKIDVQWEFAVCLRKLKQGLYQSRRIGCGGR